MAFNSKGEFPEQDRLILELTSKSDWIPPDPAALVSPYLEKNGLSKDAPIEKRREKAQQVMDGYGKIIEECQVMRADLEKKCKNVVIPLNPDVDVRVIEAGSRLFRRKITEITFEMYKEAIERLAKISNDATPKLGDL